MKITHVVNKITKTSVPAMWVDAFSRFSNNHSNLTQFKFSLIPTILNADIIHLHQIKSGFLVVFCAFFFRKKTIFTVHGSRDYLSTINKVLIDLLSLMVNHITVVNSSLLGPMKRSYFFRFYSHKVEVIQNGIDLSIDKVKDEKIFKAHGLNSNNSTIIFPARFVREKNHINAVKAIAKVVSEFSGELRVICPGDGILFDNVVTEVNRNGLAEIFVFPGTLLRKDVLALMNDIDVYLMPSISEGLNVSFLEALVFRNKIVVSDIPSFQDFFAFAGVTPSNFNVVLADPYDIDELAKKILYQLNLKDISLADLGVIDISTMVSRYNTIYSRIVGS